MNDTRRRRLLAVGAIAIAAGTLTFLAVGGIGESLVYYWSPTELTEAGERSYGATIRLGGLVAPGSINYGDDGLTLSFSVTDGETTVPVVGTAVPPAMFREGIGVVLEGTMTREGHFATERLMVKHDNEYQAPNAEDKRSMEELMKSLKLDT